MAAVDEELRRLDATVAEHFANGIDYDLARDADAQGIGGPTKAREGEQDVATDWRVSGAVGKRPGIPGIRLARTYQRSWLRPDVLAAVTVWALLVPQALAYAQLAKVDPVVGLYAAMGAAVGYVLLGGVRSMNVGPEVANRWMFPVICLPFSLLVGLLVKYRHAPTTLDESLLDSLAGDVSKIDWRTLPINVVMAWASLFSGAVLGPEGGIGGIGSKIAALYGEKVGIPVEHRSQLIFSTLASAYNGLVANPLFTGVLGADLIADPEKRGRNLPANLIGGAIGYFVFFALKRRDVGRHIVGDQPARPSSQPTASRRRVRLHPVGASLMAATIILAGCGASLPSLPPNASLPAVPSLPTAEPTAEPTTKPTAEPTPSQNPEK